VPGGGGGAEGSTQMIGFGEGERGHGGEMGWRMWLNFFLESTLSS